MANAVDNNDGDDDQFATWMALARKNECFIYEETIENENWKFHLAKKQTENQ